MGSMQIHFQTTINNGRFLSSLIVQTYQLLRQNIGFLYFTQLFSADRLTFAVKLINQSINQPNLPCKSVYVLQRILAI